MIGSRFFSWLVSKIRFARFAFSTRTRLLTFGAIYKGSYSNWKHDPSPLIFVMYSGPKITHAININYMNRGDKTWFAHLIYMVRRGGQIIDGYTLYKLFKMRRMSVVKTCYRTYFTNLLNMKLVSAGFTSLDKMIYTFSRDPWVIALNEMIKPTEMAKTPEIAFSPTELQERVITAANAMPITQGRVSGGPMTRKAPWVRQ